MRHLFYLLILLSAGCASGAGTPGFELQPLAAGDEPLEPGDMVRVGFSVERDLNGDFPVDETFGVGLPLLGWTNVQGMSGSALRDSLVLAYGTQLRNQTVQVTPLRRVRVMGAVQNPGLYHIDPTMTLLDAIALAGGPATDGQLNGVDIIRDGTVVASNLGEADLVGSFVRSGDQIMVPSRSWFSRNAGWVIGTVVSASAIIYAAIINTSN